MINIKRAFYTLASVNEDAAELTLYGDVIEARPIDWWTDEPVEGNYIVQDEFLDDLEEIKGCRSLTIRMNSLGGDAGVALTIHNRLRELARDGMDITCVVDGVAMSAGSLIMCAADTVQVNPASLIMIHNAWTYIWGGYNSGDLREVADSLDAWDKAQAAIYMRKTGMEESEILGMMAETTYMTGREAVDRGFADEMLDTEETPVAASADRRFLMVHGRKMHVAPGMSLPENIPTVAPDAEATPAPVVNNNLPESTGEGGSTMTLEELRQEHPELVSEIEASVSHDSAVEAERQRIREIDQIAGLFSDELVQEAKYGENPCSAMELSHRAAMAAVQQGTNFLTNLQADANASGTASVGATPAPEGGNEPKTEEQKMSSARASVKKALGKEEK